MQELLISARFKMYLLSVVFYNLDGEPIGYVAIDNSCLLYTSRNCGR